MESVANWNGKAKWYESSIRKMLSNEKYKGDALLPFINAFNELIEDKDYFICKWQEKLLQGNVFQRYKAGQLIRIIVDIMPITEFEVDLYFALLRK